MKSLKLKDILVHLKGELLQGNENLLIKNVETKAAKVNNYTLLFAFRQTKSAGLKPSNAIVTKNPLFWRKNKNLTIIKVKDIKKAYWDFVRYYRDLFDIPVIGVTGTCGKTTTTEMIKTILSGKYKVHATSVGKNALFRNLPYLLGLDDETQAAIFELGVTHPGNITNSCQHFQPQTGVLLNIGTYHLKGCKTLANYIKAKGELVDGIKPDGTLILNADDENIKQIDLSSFLGRIVYFGFGRQAHYRAKNVRSAKGGMEFTLGYQNKSYPFFVPGYGEHNVYNALAAIAATHTTGIDFKEVRARLATFSQVGQHLQLKPGLKGCTIIDDTWNCTPPSMEAALKVLKLLKGKLFRHKSVAVLGYMPQLGASAMDEYRKIGDKVVSTGVDVLITLGEEAKQIGDSALARGFAKDKLFNCHTAAELFNVVERIADKHTLMLFKFPYKYRLSKDPSYRKFIVDIYSTFM